MLKNYLKIAYRNIVKQKICSLINILGLALITMGYTVIKSAITNPIKTIHYE